LTSDDEGIEERGFKNAYLRRKSAQLPQYASCTDLELTEDEDEDNLGKFNHFNYLIT